MPATAALGLGAPSPAATVLEADLLAVTGGVALDGTMAVLAAPSYGPKVGDRFQVLSAGGGVAGQFTDLLDPFLGRYAVHFDVVYEPLDSGAGDPREAALIDFLNATPGANLPPAYDAIAPEELVSMFDLAAAGADLHLDVLRRRMDSVRSGFTGFSLLGGVSGSASDAYGPRYSDAYGPRRDAPA